MTRRATAVKAAANRTVTSADYDLMERFADELAAGNENFFLAHERQWRNSGLFIAMHGEPDPEPEQTLDPVAIYAKWNSAGGAKASRATEQRDDSAGFKTGNPQQPLDAKAIYAKWNSKSQPAPSPTNA